MGSGLARAQAPPGPGRVSHQFQNSLALSPCPVPYVCVWWGGRQRGGAKTTRHLHPASSACAAQSSSPPPSGSECTCKGHGGVKMGGRGGRAPHTKRTIVAQRPGFRGREGARLSHHWEPFRSLLASEPSSLSSDNIESWLLPGEGLGARSRCFPSHASGDKAQTSGLCAASWPGKAGGWWGVSQQGGQKERPEWGPQLTVGGGKPPQPQEGTPAHPADLTVSASQP